MSVRSVLVALVSLAAFSLLLTIPVSAQDSPEVEAVAVTLTATPSGNHTVPGQTGTATVEVAAVCKLPSALAPGLTIEHSVAMDETLGSASVTPSSQTVTFQPTQCADGTPTTYTVEVEFTFAETAPYDRPVKLTFTSQPKLEGNPAATTEWDERPDIYGTLDAQQEYNGTVRTGAANELGFWFLNKLTNSVVDVSATISVAPGIGTVTFDDGASVGAGDERLHRFIYTPDEEGTDRFTAEVTASVGDRVVYSKELTYEVLSDPDADAARIDPGVRGGSPGPGILVVFAAAGVAALLRRRGGGA